MNTEQLSWKELDETIYQISIPIANSTSKKKEKKPPQSREDSDLQVRCQGFILTLFALLSPFPFHLAWHWSSKCYLWLLLMPRSPHSDRYLYSQSQNRKSKTDDIR